MQHAPHDGSFELFFKFAVQRSAGFGGNKGFGGVIVAEMRKRGQHVLPVAAVIQNDIAGAVKYLYLCDAADRRERIFRGIRLVQRHVLLAEMHADTPF